MYNKQMKKAIIYALDMDIVNIETKDGYNEADILHISSYNKEHLDILSSIIKTDGYHTKIITIKKDITNNLQHDLYNLFCVFSEDKWKEDYYKLK